MPSVRQLAPSERATFDALLARLAPDTPPLARAALGFELAAGGLRCWRIDPLDGPPAALLARVEGGAIAVLGTLGTLLPADLALAFRGLTTGARLAAWDAAALPGWQAALGPLGARPFERRAFVQDLARVPAVTRGTAGPLAPQLGMRPWAPDDREVWFPRLAAARAGQLDGFFLAAPKPPSPAACRAAYEAIAAPGGGLLPVASFVATLAGAPAGVVLMVEGPGPAAGALWDLWVEPAARGLGAARALVGAAQRALWASGRTTHHFRALGANDPVMRLFTAGEIVAASATAGGWWAGPGAEAGDGAA